MPANLTLAKYFALFFAAINAPAPWNSPAARSDAEIALRGREQKLDNPFYKTAGCSAEHEILGEYELPYKTHKARLVIAASKDPHPARLHDLIVNTSGTEGGKKFRKTERYHFNGKEYVLVP